VLCGASRPFEESGGWHEQAAPRVSAETPRPDAARPQLRNWAEENDLPPLGPETNMPRWDGTSPDYELAVSGLLSDG